MSSGNRTPSPRPIPAPTSSPESAPEAPTPEVATKPARRSSSRTSLGPEARAVKAYLDALDACNGTPGLRDAQLESLNRRKKALKSKLAGASSWQQLKIYSDLEEVDADLDTHRKSERAARRLAKLEPGFVAHAVDYARSAGIPPQRFAKLGIEERVLAEAGLI